MAGDAENSEAAKAADAAEALSVRELDKPYFYDVAELDGYTMEQMMGDSPDAEE